MVHVRRQPPDPAGLPPCGRSGCRSRQHPGPGAQRRAIAWCPSLGRTKRKRAIARSKPHPLRAHFLQPAPTAHASTPPTGPAMKGASRQRVRPPHAPSATEHLCLGAEHHCRPGPSPPDDTGPRLDSIVGSRLSRPQQIATRPAFNVCNAEERAGWRPGQPVGSCLALRRRKRDCHPQN